MKHWIAKSLCESFPRTDWLIKRRAEGLEFLKGVSKWQADAVLNLQIQVKWEVKRCNISKILQLRSYLRAEMREEVACLRAQNPQNLKQGKHKENFMRELFQLLKLTDVSIQPLLLII